MGVRYRHRQVQWGYEGSFFLDLLIDYVGWDLWRRHAHVRLHKGNLVDVDVTLGVKGLHYHLLVLRKRVVFLILLQALRVRDFDFFQLLALRLVMQLIMMIDALLFGLGVTLDLYFFLVFIITLWLIYGTGLLLRDVQIVPFIRFELFNMLLR